MNQALFRPHPGAEVDGEKGVGQVKLAGILRFLLDSAQGVAVASATESGFAAKLVLTANDFFHHRLADAHGVDRFDRFVGAQGNHAFHAVVFGRVTDVLGRVLTDCCYPSENFSSAVASDARNRYRFVLAGIFYPPLRWQPPPA